MNLYETDQWSEASSTWLSANERMGSDDWIIGRMNAKSVKKSVEGANIFWMYCEQPRQQQQWQQLSNESEREREKKERKKKNCQYQIQHFIQLLWEPNCEEKPNSIIASTGAPIESLINEIN